MHSTTNWIGLLVVTLAISTTAVMAEEKIYRWVDADGVVHFGDQPNRKFDSQELTVSKGPESVPPEPAGATPAAETGTEEIEPSYAQQRRDQRAKQRKEAAKKKEEVAASCDLHQNLVAQLEPMTRVIVQREDGTVERMDDDERVNQLKKSKDFVAENCRN